MRNEDLRASLCDLRFTHDDELVEQIQVRCGEWVREREGRVRSLLDARRGELLGNTVCVTAELVPDVYAAFRDCVELLTGSDQSGNLYVQQSHDYNANVFSDGHRFDVVVNSGLLEDFSADELKFVLGHELGHVLYEHSRLPVTEMLADSDDLQAEEAVLLLRWSRASEISADRIGLLCAGHLTVAVTALFKTMSGLKGMESDAILRSFRKQYDELQSHQQETGSMSGWARTHPLMAVRFKALEMSALDIAALRSKAAEFSWNSFRALDRQIARTLSSLENPGSPSRGMRSRRWQLCALTALLYGALEVRSRDCDYWEFISEVHSALDSELPIGSMIDAVEQDSVAFRQSAISEIRSSLDVLVGNDAEKIIRLTVLMLATGTNTVPHPSRALRELVALLEVADVDTMVDEVDTGKPVAWSISRILYGD